jgi:hypothetical protein
MDVAERKRDLQYECGEACAGAPTPVQSDEAHAAIIMLQCNIMQERNFLSHEKRRLTRRDGAQKDTRRLRRRALIIQNDSLPEKPWCLSAASDSQTLEQDMKKIATGTVAALLIAATTSLAMAQSHHSRRYYDYYGGFGQSQNYNTSPSSMNSGIEQER